MSARAAHLLGRVAALALGALALEDCVPHMRAVGPPLAVPPGPPTSRCEAAQWLYLVPADVDRDERTVRGAPDYYRYARGVGVTVGLPPVGTTMFPLPVTDVLHRPSSAALLRRHLAPTSGSHGRRAVGFGVIVGSAVLAALGGVAVAGATSADDAQTTVVSILGVGGIGLVGILVGLAILPSDEMQGAMLYREHLFYPHEDDLDEARSSVAAHNTWRRQRCARPHPDPLSSGSPAPSS